jgi:hypothetical protein
MTKKIIPFNAYIGASEASDLLSKKLGRPVSSEYIRKLAKRKKQPVRTKTVSNRLLYNRDDILASTVKQKHPVESR